MKSKRRQEKKTSRPQQYDVATKVLMDKAADRMLEEFLGIHATDIE